MLNVTVSACYIIRHLFRLALVALVNVLKSLEIFGIYRRHADIALRIIFFTINFEEGGLPLRTDKQKSLILDGFECVDVSKRDSRCEENVENFQLESVIMCYLSVCR